MLFKYIKNEKGMALAVVMMAMLVMFLIGASFISVSAYQNTQASNQDKGMQAHYLAQGGAEAALEAWLNAPNDTKPSGTLDTVYLNSSNEFKNVNSNSKGKFDVSITNNSTTTLISSVGTVGEIQKKVSVTINTIQSVIPAPNPNYISGVGFYDYTSGQINALKGSNFEWPPTGQSTTGIVKNEAKKGKGLKIPNKNTGTVQQTFEKMLFSSPVQVLHNKIILKANVLVFMDDVDYSSNNDSKGALVLKVYSGITPSPASGNWGIAIFNGAGYYFKDITEGVILRNQGDVATRIAEGSMVLITDPNVLKPFLDEVLGNPLTVTSYSILWSK